MSLFRGASGIFSCARTVILSSTPKATSVSSRWMSKVSTETDEEFDTRYENYFNKKDIDSWDLRKAMNDLCGMDMVTDPKVINAALRACRRINDYALAVRFIEAVKFKCGPHEKTIWPYIMQEINPTLEELGVDTPEKMGYDKPELALKSVYDM